MAFSLDDLNTLAHGVADGVPTMRLAEQIGADRIVLRNMMERGDLLRRMAHALASPDELGADGLAHLLAAGALPGERIDNVPLRQAFADAVRAAFPDWFKRRDERQASDMAKAAAEAQRQERLAARRERRAARIEAQREECRRADYWNLMSLCELHRREWEHGTPDECKRRLTTPQQLERRRRKHGLTWGCAGFGVYYAETWSAARCALVYDTPDAASFTARHNAPQYAAAWREIEAEQAVAVEQAYADNPLRRRDKQLPTTEAAARALFDKLGLEPPANT